MKRTNIVVLMFSRRAEKNVSLANEMLQPNYQDSTDSLLSRVHTAPSILSYSTHLPTFQNE